MKLLNGSFPTKMMGSKLVAEPYHGPANGTLGPFVTPRKDTDILVATISRDSVLIEPINSRVITAATYKVLLQISETAS